MSIIQTINISKSYGRGKKKRQILCDVSLSIDKGEFVAITGPSGCGKSTFLSILGLLQPPTSGDIVIEGISCVRFSGSAKARLRRDRISFVFQDFALLSNYTVEQNIMLPFVYDGISVEARLLAIAFPYHTFECKRVLLETAGIYVITVAGNERWKHYPVLIK